MQIISKEEFFARQKRVRPEGCSRDDCCGRIMLVSGRGRVPTCNAKHCHHNPETPPPMINVDVWCDECHGLHGIEPCPKAK